MKFRRFILIAGSLVAASIVVCVALISYWQRSQPMFHDAPKLVAAIHAYAHDRTARGEALPAFVSLRELVAGGYMASHDLRAFEGMDVTLSPTAGDDKPQDVVIHARMADGTHLVLFGDGSGQVVAK